MSALALVAGVLAVSVALGLLLAVLVWSENEREPMRRDQAERRARRDTDETVDGRSNDRDSRWD
jgi:Flp pilus assembly protein TadB